ncbi:MAG: methyltransferase [Rhodobiaceae bacterium]|nr:MAG: methyltransferase [Rhodobiaceae bacterium]
MELALAHPKLGYYTTRDPLGAGGDFTTSPEISQMFGELLGLWCVDMWEKLGRPDPFVFAEIGPGRGTLMADALRAASLVPEFTRAAQVALVEISPILRTEQLKNVPSATWYTSLADLPNGPILLLANEFFDALPIRQFQRTDRGWCERCITLQRGDPDAPPSFQFGLKPDPLAVHFLPSSVANAPEGAIVETSPATDSVVTTLAERLHTQGGAALIIDYGHAHSAAGDTLQAMKNHAFADPLAEPGHADITAHVDFENLQTKAVGASAYGPVEQGAFLERLGISARAENLKQRATPDQAEEIETALHRLTGRTAMGRLFKVMSLTGPGTPAPAGFE